MERESGVRESDRLGSPLYHHSWSPEQRQTINLIQKGLSHENEEARINSRRWLYVQWWALNEIV